MCGCGILEQRWKRTRGVASVASEDDIVSVQLTADQIMLCAYTICHAASPPLPACGPDVSVEDQVRQATDWLLDSDYEDAHLCISIGGAWAANNRQRGVEVAIRLQPVHADEADHRQNETDDGTVFVGYELFDIGKGPPRQDGVYTVELLKPGPWIDHLVAVALRARQVIQGRSNPWC